ncbi:rho guanine nucleotide exchange factor 12-like isoform X2 [Adelges cooleyi]|uniref:rho guanine nucleotide exchange factor 12-like isoform X2 n=1 Tax=Adelges cooleyi TaxID=133065 RepID=UPI00217FA87D|nr:rho guanine nucleotide exchange factor 12-like isoform X2 [Adelges cooleyi]
MESTAADTHKERSAEHLSQPSVAECLDTASATLSSTITLTVLVVKDERGYGMKVSGDNPVFVQSVKLSGAAEKAGLHSGDKIIKVNGINVTHSTHTEVVELIKSSTQVELTVQKKPLFIINPPPNPNLTLPPLPLQAMNSGTVASSVTPSPTVTPSRPLHHHHSAPARDRITGPQPVDVEQMRHVELERWQTFRLMLEKEQRYVEALKKELQRTPDVAGGDNYKLIRELSGAERRVKTLQDQLHSFNEIPLCNIVAQPSAAIQPPPLPPRNPPPLPPRNPTAPPISSDKQSNISNSTGVNNNETDSPNLSLCHQRTKSNPDQLGEGKPTGSKKLTLSESFNDLHLVKHSKGGLAWDVVSPPRRNSPNRTVDVASPSDKLNKQGDQCLADAVDSNDTKPAQTPIISMEDDDVSDQESSHLEEHGPFKSFTRLVEHNAHLAVFLNYVISNSDPSSLLFYLVTNLYKEGNAKEMKKWAYEIHSSFLVPYAPLRLTNIEEYMVREIDDILQKQSDREEILRKVFWKARTKAKEELNEQLCDFRHRRTAGLGTLFGPPDSQLDDSDNDKVKELKIIEMILVPNMEPFIEDMEKDSVDDRRFTMAAALATVMSKMFGLRGAQFSSFLERCPTFVSKEKSLKAKLIGKCRKFTSKGHHFVAHQYFTVTYCNHCQLIIWGIGPQGYQCTNCILNLHRNCVKQLDENCPGPIMKKEKANDRISKLMDKIRPEREARRKPTLTNFVQIEKSKRQTEDAGDVVGALPEKDSDRTSLSGSSFLIKTDDSFKSDKGDTSVVDDISHCPKTKPSTISINRSESYKERIHQKRQIRERRKTSDPNLPSKYKSDVESELQFSFARSESSSNSNLSTKSLDSRSTSLEGIGPGGEITSCLYSDSDHELDLPDWASNVTPEILEKLSPKEKKRQEVINELYHTERSHIRGLKVLEHVFHRPMRESQVLPHEQLQLLFANLEQMYELHSQFSTMMKAVRKDNQVVQNIGHVLLNTFDGLAGETFQKAAATFCARQQIALEFLKESRKKDPKLNKFLTEAEGNPVCKRLQLKDILPTGMIRLTKYPLLFESLVKCTNDDQEELANIKRAFERSKIILNHVNQAVREAEDELRLSGIQKKLDASPFEKVDHLLSYEYKNLDVTKHKLIHEGGLWLRIGGTRQKMIELHVLLLEDLIILLNKVDDKYVLKYYGFQDRTPTLSPIIKLSTALVRHNAVDKKAMFLVNTSQAGAQIYDLVTTSSNERKTWFRHISEATDAYKAREGKMRKTEPQQQSPHHVICDYEDIMQQGGSSSAKKKSLTAENCAEPPNNNNNNNTSLNTSQLSTTSLLDTSNNSCNNTSIRGGGNEDGFTTKPEATNSSNPTVAVVNNSSPAVLSKTQKSPLIEPSEVLVSQSSVLKAEPVITHLEKLRRNNKVIEEALHERLQLVADILKVPLVNNSNSDDNPDQNSSDEPNKILLSAVSQGNEIITVLNESMNMTDVDTIAASLGTSNLTSNCSLYKAYALQLSRITKVKPIVNSLNSQITELLISTTKHGKLEEELRKELQTYRERLHAFQEKSLTTPNTETKVPETTAKNTSINSTENKNNSSSLEV